MAAKRTVADIIGQALVDAGYGIMTFVPGAGANEIYAEYTKLARKAPHVSFHEEVSFAIAHGAAVYGRRAVSIMKAQGLAKASNAILTALSAGTNAACLTIIADDKQGKASDNIIDTPALLRGMGMPFVVARRDRVYQDVAKCTHLSERLSLPVAMVIESEEVPKLATPKTVKFPSNVPKFERDVFQNIVCPLFAQYQLKVLQAKRAKKNWRSIKPPIQPMLPHSVPEHYKAATKEYIALFSQFRDIRGDFVTGDVGVTSIYAFRPYECIDLTTYMGGSIPLGIGAMLAGAKNVWAVTGDFSFVAAGGLGLLEASQRGLPLKVLVCFNGKSAATGGQPVTALSLHRTVAAYAGNVKFISNPQDRSEIRSVLNEAVGAKDLRIVVANYT